MLNVLNFVRNDFVWMEQELIFWQNIPDSVFEAIDWLKLCIKTTCNSLGEILRGSIVDRWEKVCITPSILQLSL